MRHVVLLAVFSAIASPAHSEPALKGWTGPKPKTDCQCRHADGKANLGETICRRLNGRMVTLRCDLVLNNTNWTQIAEGCGVATSPPESLPHSMPSRDYATLR